MLVRQRREGVGSCYVDGGEVRRARRAVGEGARDELVVDAEARGGGGFRVGVAVCGVGGGGEAGFGGVGVFV